MRLRWMLLILLLLPLSAMAAVPVEPGLILGEDELPGCDFQTGRLEAACIPVFIGHIVQLVMGFVGAAFVINVMIGGYELATGSLEGDTGKGKERIWWSIIGLIVTACAYVIYNLILYVVAG